MPPSKRELIIDTIVKKLQAAASANTGPIYRSRVQAFTWKELPVTCVTPISDSPDIGMVGAIDWTLQLRIETLVRGMVPDMVAAAAGAEIHSVLVSDKSLGGLVSDIAPGDVKFDLFNGDQPQGAITQIYIVQYRTTDGDLTQ